MNLQLKLLLLDYGLSPPKLTSTLKYAIGRVKRWGLMEGQSPHDWINIALQE